MAAPVEATFYLSGATSDVGAQTDQNLSLGDFRSSTKVDSSNDITAPINVTGVVIDKVSLTHDFKPVTGTLTSQGNTITKASLKTPTGAATWQPSGGDTQKLLLNMGYSGTVLDESGKGHVVTHLNGIATVNNVSPFTEGWSIAPDGTNDNLLTVANSADTI